MCFQNHNISDIKFQNKLITDIVKVLSFALTEGAVAVHCHAGLGRTGVIIAALLIFENGISAEQSIRKGFIS